MADSAHTTSLSRRAAMASTVAAFSLLPGAAKAASLAGHPDAELIELGRQLVPLFEEHAGRMGEFSLRDQRLRAMWPKEPETLRATEADIEMMGCPEKQWRARIGRTGPSRRR